MIRSGIKVQRDEPCSRLINATWSAKVIFPRSSIFPGVWNVKNPLKIRAVKSVCSLDANGTIHRADRGGGIDDSLSVFMDFSKLCYMVLWFTHRLWTQLGVRILGMQRWRCTKKCRLMEANSMLCDLPLKSMWSMQIVIANFAGSYFCLYEVSWVYWSLVNKKSVKICEYNYRRWSVPR